MEYSSEIKVSVIVPFYNAEATIERSLLSALHQTVREVEVLVIDDGSTDQSLAIVKEMMRKDERIKLFFSSHLGCGGARNVAMSRMRGKYLYFLDADDYMAPDLLEKMIEGIEKEGAQIAFCRFKNVDLQNRPLETPHEQNLHKFVADLRDNKYLLTPKDCITEGGTQSILWSLFRIMFVTDIIKKQGISFRVIPFAEDFIFLTTYLAFCQKACLVDEYLYFYTKQNDGSSTHSRGFHPKMSEVCLMVLHRARKILDESPLYTQAERENSCKTFSLLLAYNMILNIFCAPDCAAEYERSKRIILGMYSLQDLAEYQENLGEMQRAVLRKMQTSGFEELYALIKEYNILK